MSHNVSSDGREIDLIDVVIRVWRMRWFAALGGLIGLGLAGIVATNLYVAPEQYLNVHTLKAIDNDRGIVPGSSEFKAVVDNVELYESEKLISVEEAKSLRQIKTDIGSGKISIESLSPRLSRVKVNGSAERWSESSSQLLVQVINAAVNANNSIAKGLADEKGTMLQALVASQARTAGILVEAVAEVPESGEKNALSRLLNPPTSSVRTEELAAFVFASLPKESPKKQELIERYSESLSATQGIRIEMEDRDKKFAFKTYPRFEPRSGQFEILPGRKALILAILPLGLIFGAIAGLTVGVIFQYFVVNGSRLQKLQNSKAYM